MARTDLDPGDAVTPVALPAAGGLGNRPKWLRIAESGGSYAIEGTAELPSGHRVAKWCIADTTTEEDYYVTPQELDASEAPWRAVIWAPNGSYVMADGLTGIPVIGTPVVRLQENAPSKAVLKIAERRGEGNVLAPTFAGWSDGHAEGIRKGMELTVEYRGPQGMTMVFRGMIYEVADSDGVQVTAYDRIMDLYQFSGQYQNHYGMNDGWYAKTGADASRFWYDAGVAIGQIVQAATESIYRISNLDGLSADGSNGGYVAHVLPNVSGHSPRIGGRITRVEIAGCYTKGAHQFATLSIQPLLIYRNTQTRTFTIVQSATPHIWLDANSGTYYVRYAWDVDWTLDINARGMYLIGMRVTCLSDNDNGYLGTTDPKTRGAGAYFSEDGETWTYNATRFAPEISIDFTDTAGGEISDLSAVGTSGTRFGILASAVPDVHEAYIESVDRGCRAYLRYFIVSATPLLTVAKDLIEQAGLLPTVNGEVDLGATTFYQSSTFNYLDLLREILEGSGFGMAGKVEEPGAVRIAPAHTSAEEPVLSVSTQAGTVAGEYLVLRHDLTVHWAAEKATVAYIAEDATSSGLPLALETDDGMYGEGGVPGSLSTDLQSPLRGITADSTLGTHALMALAAGHKIAKLHTNRIDGSMVLAGYRTDLWDLYGGGAGGNPLRIYIPQYGLGDGETVIPKAIELGDGVTKITLDNVPSNERSELARSMGRTDDAISNAVRSFPATVYLFARYYGPHSFEDLPMDSTISVTLLKADGSMVTQITDPARIKTVEDGQGYTHVCAVKEATAAGYATEEPITAVRITTGSYTYTTPLTMPAYVLGGQMIHVDVRLQGYQI